MNTKNINAKTFTLSLLTAAMFSAPPAFAADPDHSKGITDALADSKVNISFRARYENVDQDTMNADALTLQSRITVKTGAYNGLSLGVEVDNVTAIVDDYNSTTNGNTTDSVVADPEGSDINQAFLQYKRGDVVATAGRQRILHNNQRFVGGVGWRQNEQTYDGVRVQIAASDSLSLDYSFINNANTPKEGNLNGEYHLANAMYKINKQNKLSAFAYILDFDTAAAKSTSTYGILYNGTFDAIKVNASYATQSDNADNATNYDANYYNLELGTKVGNVSLLAGYEVLGSDDGNASFSTPFATAHKFQGFADKFLGTTASNGFKDGVEDIYITAVTKVSGVKLVATYHDLSSDEGSYDYGTELDLVAVYPVNKSTKVVVKYATFDSEVSGGDVDKLWIQLATKF